MDSWKQYAFSLIVCAFLCGIVTQIVSDTRHKKLIRLSCGVVIGISIVSPLSQLDLKSLLCIPDWNSYAVESYIAEGQKTASEARGRYIKSACEAYILDKAMTLEADVTAQVFLNEELIPVFVEMEGESDPDVKMELERILSEELGIPKENQKWTWNQESNLS